MARPKKEVPDYRHHKTSGRARVRINGKDHWLGKYGSDESRRKYADLIAEHVAGLAVDEGAEVSSAADSLSVAELLCAYLEYAKTYYVKNGKLTAEIHCLRSAMRPLKELFGVTPAAEFGPRALKAVRAAMVDKGWTRKFCNKSVHRIRRIFRWGASNEMVPVAVVQALETLDPLLAGRTTAHDNAKRRAVPEADIEAVKAVLKQQVHKDVIDLLLVTGARPGEILNLTTGMIDRSRAVWVAEITDHKMSHRETERKLYFNATAQKILTGYLKADPEERLFRVSRNKFATIIGDACKEAKVAHWTPHWLRHTTATRVREAHGIEAAQALLGHAQVDMTAKYSTDQERQVIALVQKIG